MVEQLPAWITVATSVAHATRPDERWQAALPPNAVLLLTRFRDAYQAKDAARLGDQLSVGYRGSLYGLQSRDAFTRAMADTFAGLPRWASPRLRMTLYQVVERTDVGGFECVLEFHARIAVLGIGVRSIDSGRVSCEACAEPPHGIWRIVRIDPIG